MNGHPRRHLPLTSLLSLAPLLLIHCEKPPLTDNGVVGAFGQTGIGWGDLHYPRAIAVSQGSRIFIADKSGRIQRFSPEGQFEAGWRMPDWKSGKPIGLTVHHDGRLFIADTHYSRVMIYDQDGNFLAKFGENGLGPGQFQLVTDVVVDRYGNIYVGEYGGNDRISKFAPDLTFIKCFGDQPVGGARLSRPAGLAIDADDNLWVADACNHRIVKFGLDGEYVAGFGEMGLAPGQLRWPYDIDVRADGTLLISEYGNNRLQWFDRSGKSIRVWGQAGRNLGELYSPWGAVEAPNGLLYVLDSLNHRVQIVRAF